MRKWPSLVAFGSHFKFCTIPHRQTQPEQTLLNGRSRQRTGCICCHRLHFPLGHVQYAYSSFLGKPLPLSYTSCTKPGSESTEQRSAADTLGFRPKNVTQEMVSFVLSSLFLGLYEEDTLDHSSGWGSFPLMQMAYFWFFFFCRLTQYPICFQTFLRNYLILVGRGRISLGYFTIICSLF